MADTASAMDANVPAAVSSPADDTTKTGDKQPTSVLEAVKIRLAEDAKAAAPPVAKPDAKGSDAEAPADAKPEGEAEAGDDAEKELPFHKHPAWMRRIAKERAQSERIAQLEPMAERFTQMQSMMQRADLSPDEVTTGFNIMALMKGDPHKALAALKPFYESLLQVTGEVLPDDLRKDVDLGHVSEDRARELSRVRSEADAAKRREAAATQRTTDEATARERHTLLSDMAAGVSAWETEWSKKDPDYARKLPLVEAQVKALRQERPPRNRAEAAKLAQDALDAVNASLRPFAPKKDAVAPPIDGSSAKPIAVPKNSIEAANAALAQMGA
ncbi:MAG: hypothetical protein A3E78_12175 [Alphaproteobacteria bacterium RIFCSPHIGHO2_12_FULL_63_12]|nr:MAG: hypothetical protein A3E78_12175 [Alphaproteobacteria bacterium RIFCSPHIGHO2_12_FULL_63_12]